MRGVVLAAVGIFLLISSAAPEKIGREKILATGKEWQEGYDAFKAEPELLEVLGTRADDQTRIDVYLGLWCSDSRRNVPPFIRIMDELKAAARVNYYTVERKPAGDVKYFVEDLQVERVPTFIVYRGDREIGRIVENPKVTMLDDLIQILLEAQ
jgi:hypothetical protein